LRGRRYGTHRGSPWMSRTLSRAWLVPRGKRQASAMPERDPLQRRGRRCRRHPRWVGSPKHASGDHGPSAPKAYHRSAMSLPPPAFLFLSAPLLPECARAPSHTLALSVLVVATLVAVGAVVEARRRASRSLGVVDVGAIHALVQ